MTSAEDKFFGVKTQIGKKTESLTDDDAQYELGSSMIVQKKTVDPQGRSGFG